MHKDLESQNTVVKQKLPKCINNENNNNNNNNQLVTLKKEIAGTCRGCQGMICFLPLLSYSFLHTYIHTCSNVPYQKTDIEAVGKR